MPARKLGAVCVDGDSCCRKLCEHASQAATASHQQLQRPCGDRCAAFSPGIRTWSPSSSSSRSTCIMVCVSLLDLAASHTPSACPPKWA